ncbi:TetR/AcrR family transcriptional regulator [Methylobacterium gossipiicola]|uniref:DNA-binding transcriptional regulator, AcrR family n=1 Tax=Methylobacterium gossipiicola TaxID=582675 RepID=A0A1I2T1P7_9HYPH|nr:TetR/AcrR family transcriptional regulator [Methylobacterium gossipiicola]SFG58720.1 DNA-binding transcriptional regulator, AcrR family [Methylobacterium gossipiicola]
MTSAAVPMTPLPETDIVPEESGPTTRCRILETAEAAFREIGYQKTTVADIARSLRMSPANVYRFFESKKAIHEAVIQRLMGETEQSVALAVENAGAGAADRIGAVIRALHRTCAERCEANPRMQEMVAAAVSESWDVCAQHIERVAIVFETLVREGVATGEFNVDDPKLAAACLHTAVVRYCHPTLVSQYPDAGIPPLEAMIAFLLKGLRGVP